MCGFIGIVTKEKTTNNILSENNRIICRGPDETKNLKSSDDEINIDFLFNRLSILELSSNGSQPMVSEDGDHIMMFNGEIFNYIELKKYLKEHNTSFVSKNSDAEVLFLGLRKEGKEFIKKLIGQFSIVYLDKSKKEILLVRDRTGQKPLFYSYNKKNIYFGSNLKSVSNISNSFNLNLDGLREFLNLGVVTSPNTIFNNVYKVNPGEMITFHYGQEFEKSKYRYWNPNDYISENVNFNDKDFDDIVSDSLEIRLRSDVPVAAFCSGGLDSTLIIKKLSNLGHQIPTFSVINKNPKYDERKFIKQVTDKYATEITMKEVDTEACFDDILENISVFDEPYMDASNFPSSFISKQISTDYKVAISGDGGDEIFFGYERFQNEFNSSKLFENLVDFLYWIYPSWLGTGNKILKFNKNYKKSYASYFEDLKFLNFLGFKYKSNFASKYLSNSDTKFKNIIILENQFYLSEMMNLKVDRTSMNYSLEVRSPFIDHRLIEYILSCRSESINYKKSKKYVKDYLAEDFTPEFLNRKKMGFVFDLESIIFSEQDRVIEIINNSGLNKYIPKLNIKKLFLRKSRINSLRIYKLLILAEFIKNK